MHRVETTISVADVQQVVQQIADRFRPQMVILFGSYAHGTPTADSNTGGPRRSGVLPPSGT